MPLQNMVTNGDFELSTGDNFDNWTETESGSATITADSTTKHSGTQSCKFGVDASGTCTITYAGIFTIGESYTISFWAKGDAGAVLYMPEPFSNGGLGLSTSWKYYQYSGTATTTDLVIKEFFGNTDFWVDDVRVVSNNPVKVVVKRVSLPTTGTVDCTETDFGDVKAALVFLGYAGEGATAAAQSMSVGAWDGTNQCCAQGGSDNQKATMDAGRAFYDTRIAVAAYNETVIAAYTIANITDGVRFTFVAGGTAAVRTATVIMFGGTDVEAEVDTFIANTTSGGRNKITGVPFRPEALFFGTSGYASTGTTTIDIMGFGVATSQNGIQNRSMLWWDHDAVSTSNCGNWMSNVYAIAQLYLDTITWGGTVDAITADGFEMEITGSSGSDLVWYLALYLGGYNIHLEDLIARDDQEGGPGIRSQTGLGFKPAAVLACMPIALVHNQNYNYSSVSIGASDGTTESCISAHSQDAVGTSNVGGYSQEKLITMRATSNSGELVTANIDNFNDDGYDINYTAVHSTSNYLGFAMSFQTEDNPRLISTAANKLWMVNHGV